MTSSQEPSMTSAAQTVSQNSLPSALQALLRTREMRETLSILIPEIVNLWAGDHFLKKKAAQPIGRSIQKGLQQARAKDREDENEFGNIVPEILERLLAAFQSKAEAAEALTPEEKLKHLKALGTCFATEQSGRILTSLMRSLHDLHQTHPNVLAEVTTPAIRNWIEQTDFGTLRDVADTMTTEVRALAETINAILWQYPSKLVLLLSFLPDLLNMAVIALQETLRRFNKASPDLVADIALSLLRSVDGKTLGAALNEMTEVIRKIHTGSALIGDPGLPRLQNDLRQLFADILGELDSPAYWAARVAIEEDKEIMADSLLEAIIDRPDILFEGLQTYAARKNPGLRVGRLRLQAMAEIPDDDMRQALKSGFSDLDLQTWSDTVNLACASMNRAMTLKPELMPYLAQQVAGALDIDEIEAASGNTLQAGGAAFQPVLRALLPDIITQICQALAPADDEYEAKTAQAREQLRTLLMVQEATL